MSEPTHSINHTHLLQEINQYFEALKELTLRHADNDTNLMEASSRLSRRLREKSELAYDCVTRARLILNDAPALTIEVRDRLSQLYKQDKAAYEKWIAQYEILKRLFIRETTQTLSVSIAEAVCKQTIPAFPAEPVQG